jgi:hypothetical protein
VVDYTTADQARAAAEVDMLPQSALIVRMLSDYAVLRERVIVPYELVEKRLDCAP